MGSMADMQAQPSWALIAAMWAAMMVAMMLPSASPTILLYAHVHRHSNGYGSAPPTAAFLGGYIACWLGFALIAATLQVALGGMELANRNVAAALLIATGLYQLSPLKDACLNRCRSPAQFLSRHYAPGAKGAARLGLLHGAYCVGCCWLLMALLLVVGVMNLAWVALLTAFLTIEKLCPWGRLVSRVSGVALVMGSAVVAAA